MKKSTLYVIASLFTLISLFLIVYGFQAGVRWLWLAGLGVITVAMLLSLATRWVEERSEPDEKSEEQS